MMSSTQISIIPPNLFSTNTVVNRVSKKASFSTRKQCKVEVVRKDRSVNGRSGGGVCMYLRNNINYQIRDDLCDGQLECVVIEIIRPHSRPFFVSTWYKPPNSAQDVFRQFESLVDKVDSEQKDFYLLGDLNCNMLDGSNNHKSSTLTNILDIYGLSQLISEPTRITPTSRTLIDLCITSLPEKISLV